MCKTLFASVGAGVAVLLTAGVSMAQNFDPIALTPSSYTVDIVVETNAALSLPAAITATQGGGPPNSSGDYNDATWYEIGFRLPPYNVTNGLPHPGATFTDLGNANVQYVMPPSYVTNNVFFLDGLVSSASMMLNVPTTATNLSFLGSSGGGSGTVNYTVYHANGDTETGTLTFPDWFNNTPYAYTTSGRVYPQPGYDGYTDSEGGTNPRLYSEAITVSDVSPVTNVDFTYSSGGHVAIFAVSGNAAGTAWTPIPVSNFNEDIVAEAMQPTPVNATMDQGTNLSGTLGQNTWFEQGYDAAAPSAGLPPAGSTFTSASQPTHTYRMAASYTGNNAILIDADHRSINITPASPASYSAFTILTAGGNVVSGNTMTNLIILQHDDGTAETNLFYGYDWYDGAQPVAYAANGRVNIGAPTFNDINNGNPKLFESVFGLADTVSPVTNILVQYSTAPYGNSTTYIMAISAASGAVAPIISLQSKEVNVFSNGTAIFNVSLSAGSEPLHYQWQKDGLDLTDGGNISGSGTTNLVISGVTGADAGQYQLIITNVAGSTVSAMIPLTVMSTLPDVTSPADPVAAYEPNGGSSPSGSGPDMAIDNTTSEFQDFGGNGGSIPFSGPVGFVVTPLSGASIVTGLRVYAATTAAVDDPTDYTLEGSTDGVNFTTISSGSLSLLDYRNPGGKALNPTNQILTEVDFDNATPYTSYRVSFNSVKDLATADSIRVGEVELLGTNSGSGPVIVRDIHNLSATNYISVPNTFSLQVAGTPTLSYVWSQDGTVVVVTTNASYTFPTIAGVHTYSCLVTNDYGATNSLTATVTGIDITGSTTFTVNLNDYDNFALEYGQNQFNPYVGPGAYPGAGSGDFWNGFGLESNGKNPYPANGLLSDLAGIQTPITYDINYDGNNGGLYFSAGPYQGTPAFLLGQTALVSGSNVGTLTLHNVPAGSYDLYLYSANFDGTRGAQFTVGSVTAVNGMSAAANPNTSGGSGPLNTFVLGQDYVQFNGVIPDSNGDIAITWTQNPNDNSGGGEGDLNGMSLVRTGAAPTQMAIQMSAGSLVISWNPTNGILQSSTNVAGPYIDMTGQTSPYTNTFSEKQEFFRVKLQP